MVDRLAGNAEIDEKVQVIFDGGSVENMVETQIANERDYCPYDYFTHQCLKGKGYKRGEGTKSALKCDSRRKMNQLLCETVSINTLRWTVARRAEQMWACATCYDANLDSRYASKQYTSQKPAKRAQSQVSGDYFRQIAVI